HGRAGYLSRPRVVRVALPALEMAAQLPALVLLRFPRAGPPMSTSLSVLVPVYNEQYLVAASLDRLKVLETSPHLDRIQVVVVDDCSKDDTPRALEQFRAAIVPGKISWTFLRHEKNGGKGKAIQTALQQADCEIT